MVVGRVVLQREDDEWEELSLEFARGLRDKCETLVFQGPGKKETSIRDGFLMYYS